MEITTTTDHRSTVVGIYDAFGRGDIAGVLEAVADEVDWALDPAAPVVAAVPWLRHVTAKADVAHVYFAGAGQLGWQAFEPLAIAQDGDQVVSVIHERFTVPATGQTFDGLATHYFRFGEDGRINYYRPIVDTEAFIAAFSGE